MSGSVEDDLLQLKQELQACRQPVPPRDDLRTFCKLVRACDGGGGASAPCIWASSHRACHTPTTEDAVLPTTACVQSREARMRNAEDVARFGLLLLQHHKLSEDECELLVRGAAADVDDDAVRFV
jgi:hypothetical protein